MTTRIENLPNVLKCFAAVLILSAILGCGLLYDLSKRGDFDSEFSVFVIISMTVHAFVGFAILSRKAWGLVVFKCYLYVLFVAIPVGTYIAYKTLQYIERNSIVDFYNGEPGNVV